jgi:hypothetical protein
VRAYRRRSARRIVLVAPHDVVGAREDDASHWVDSPAIEDATA